MQTGSNRQTSGLEEHFGFCNHLESLLGMAQPVLLTGPVQKPEAASQTELAGATGWLQHVLCLNCIIKRLCKC